ncbi:MAG TPA: hypothetical protein VE982_03630 [Gaiellaceae bacterium]|nr:hypothetical protein [Gaiellaceae bacterium]
MDVELARRQWEDGSRRIEDARADRRRYALLLERVEVVVDALRRRVGQTFTLAELADAYEGADEWARPLLEGDHPGAPAVPEAGTVADAAFHVYARGASDYAP